MQKKLLAVAVAGALGAPAFALAQNATVNVYGKFYAEYAKVNQGTANVLPAGQALVDVDLLQAPGSALGFRGEEKLGGNLSAWFQCESSYDFRGQNVDGLCGRNSALGLKGGFGNVFVGVWDTPFKRVQDAVGSNDTGVFGSAFVLMGNSTTTTAGNTNQAVFKRRQVNSINYDTPSFGGFQAMGSYTTLNSQTGVVNSTAGSKPRLWSLAAKYGNGPLNVYAGYEKHNDITNNGVAAFDDKGWELGANYTFGNKLKVGGLYSQQKWQTGVGLESKVNVWHLGIDWMFSGPHGIRAAYSTAGDVKGNGGAPGGNVRPASSVLNDTGVKLYQIRYVYAMSKRTEFNVGYVKINNETAARYQLGGLNNNAAGQDPSAFAINMTHSF
jgi:predicted porin